MPKGHKCPIVQQYGVGRIGGLGGEELVYIGSGVDSLWVIFSRDLNEIRVGTPIVSYLLLANRLRASLPGLMPLSSEIQGSRNWAFHHLTGT